jgi:hypothetical protein
MSGIHHFPSHPHEPTVTRYGHINDDHAGAETCSVHFYRPYSGTCFIISAAVADLQPNRLADELSAVLRADGEGDNLPSQSRLKGRMEQFRRVAEMLVGVAEGLIGDCVREAVGEGEVFGEGNVRWKSIKDYLDTPHYKLELCKAAGEGGEVAVTARVVRGPYVKPVYEMWPIASSRLPELDALMSTSKTEEGGAREGSMLAVYQAADLEVINAAKDWRGRPASVRLPDSGQLRIFRSSEATSMHMPERKMVNASLDTITAHCRVHAAGFQHGGMQARSRPNIVSLAGVVVIEAALNAYPDDSSEDTLHAEDEGINAADTQQTFVVGVLLVPDERAKPMAEYLKAQNAAAIPKERKQNWQRQIHDALEYLHSLRVTFGGSVRGEQTFYYLSQWVVLLGPSDDGESGGELQAWLSLGSNCTVHGLEDVEGFETGKEADRLGLEKTFDF